MQKYNEFVPNAPIILRECEGVKVEILLIRYLDKEDSNTFNYFVNFGGSLMWLMGDNPIFTPDFIDGLKNMLQ